MPRSKTAKAKARKTAARESAKRPPAARASAAAAPAGPLIKPPEQHSLALSILLHLLPGILTTVVYVVLGPVFAQNDIPSLAAVLVSALLIVVPFELGILLWEARRKNQSSSLVGVVLYRAFLPWWQYIVFPLLLSVLAAAVFLLLMMLNQPIIDALFQWLPDWYFFQNIAANIEDYSRTGLILTLVLLVVVNFLAGPIVEELYFRGYLLPRLSRYGKWAPVINTVLFSLYHLWSPWENLARIATFLPIAYVVRWKKNIYLGMITHVVVNIVGGIGLILLILEQLR